MTLNNRNATFHTHPRRNIEGLTFKNTQKWNSILAFRFFTEITLRRKDNAMKCVTFYRGLFSYVLPEALSLHFHYILWRITRHFIMILRKIKQTMQYIYWGPNVSQLIQVRRGKKLGCIRVT